MTLFVVEFSLSTQLNCHDFRLKYSHLTMLAPENLRQTLYCDPVHSLVATFLLVAILWLWVLLLLGFLMAAFLFIFLLVLLLATLLVATLLVATLLVATLLALILGVVTLGLLMLGPGSLDFAQYWHFWLLCPVGYSGSIVVCTIDTISLACALRLLVVRLWVGPSLSQRFLTDFICTAAVAICCISDLENISLCIPRGHLLFAKSVRAFMLAF